MEKQGAHNTAMGGAGSGPGAGPGDTGLTFAHWLRSAASPIASPSPTPGFGCEATCAWGKPNHHHLPQDKLTHRKPQFSSSCSTHSAGEQSVPFFFSAKAVFPLPLSTPSTAKPATKARFLLSFCYFRGPLYLWVAVLSWLWLLFKRAGKQGEEGYNKVSLISSKMLTERSPHGSLHPSLPGTPPGNTSSLWKWKPDHLNRRVVSGNGVGRGRILGRILTPGAHNANDKIIRGTVQISDG